MLVGVSLHLDRPDTVIAHEDLDPSPLFRQFFKIILINVETNCVHFEIEIYVIINRFPNPTDWAFHTPSSPDYRCPLKDRHDASPLVDESHVRILQGYADFSRLSASFCLEAFHFNHDLISSFFKHYSKQGQLIGRKVILP